MEMSFGGQIFRKKQGKNGAVPSMPVPTDKYQPQTFFGIAECRRNGPNKQHVV